VAVMQVKTRHPPLSPAKRGEGGAKRRMGVAQRSKLQMATT
jgi:hypothetical protein